MRLAAAQTGPSGQGRIPVLDFGAYLGGEAGAAAPLTRAIARTCDDTGFLVVANHGVPQHLVDDTFAVAQHFFARPEGDKLALKIGTYNIGYLPFGGQVVRHSPVNKNTKPNFSESFYITRDRAPDHPDIVNNTPLVWLNRWPEDMPEFRAATTAYYRAMEAMTTRLVPLFALALFRGGLRRAELHDSSDPLPAAPVARGQRVRLRAAYR
jgi:isopenicillin N synthase-like dioxygenase